MADAAWRLARALFHAAQRTGELEPVAADLARLDAVLRAAPDVYRIIHHPRISESAKDDLLGGAAETELVRRVVVSLIAAREVTLLAAINRQFQQMKRQEAGVVKVEVRTAVELTPEDASTLGAALERYVGRRPVLQIVLDPSLIAGVRVRLDGRVLDASLKSELDALEKQLLAA
jgi:F-type H+-transporting ATPase subunit delta